MTLWDVQVSSCVYVDGRPYAYLFSVCQQVYVAGLHTYLRVNRLHGPIPAYNQFHLDL